MSYMTNDDIEDRLGSEAYVQFTDDDGDGVPDADMVNEARIGTEGEVNSYLARGYQVPVDVSGDAGLAGLLKSVALDLVELRLRSRRPPIPTPWADTCPPRCKKPRPDHESRKPLGDTCNRQNP